MYQKDYILRMIEMLGDLIRGILGLIATGRFRQAEDKLDEVYYTMLHRDATFFHDLPLEGLTNALIEDHNYTNDHLQILAELFFAEATLEYARKNYDDSRQHYLKSLALFEFIDRAYSTYTEERQMRMLEIRQKISELEGTKP
jgi:hypothetical protein